MNGPNTDPDDLELRTLLRAAHPTLPIPPGFREGVWRRVERGERQAAEPGWWATFVSICFRPTYAAVVLVLVLLAGIWLGVRDANFRIRQEEQSRYVAAVSPLDARP